MMSPTFKARPVAVLFGIAVAILTWISVATYWSAYRLVGAFDAVAQGSQILDTLQYVETLMESGESSVRGYVITGNPQLRSGFEYAQLVVPYKMRQLATVDDMRASQKKKVRRVQELLNDQLSYLSHILQSRAESGYAAAADAIRLEDSASRREELAHLLSEIQQEERIDLDQRRSHVTTHSWETKLILALAGAICLALLGWSFGLVRLERTDRQEAEHAVTRTETFIHSIIERIPYMILVKEAKNLRLTLVNKAAEEWLGRSREDLVGSNEFDRLPKSEAQKRIEGDRQILQGRQSDTVLEDALPTDSGASRLIQTQKITVPDENGNPAYLLSISEDITQRRQAEKLLQLSRDAAVESARMKSEFISNMTHEIRTPLAVVIGMTDLLLDTTLTVDQKKFAATIKRSAAGLLQISKTILDFSKIEAGEFSLETQEVDVRQVLDGAVAMMQEQAKAKGIGLASFVANEIPPVVLGDGLRLRQVLTHLIGNALKFTPKGEVVVRVTESRQSETQVWLNVRITDTGIGIAEEAQKNLFQPFRQGDGSQTRRYGGTGLGLAVSKRMIDLMGGEIGFETKVNEGSTFWFTLPFNKRHVQGPVMQMSSRPWTRARVLIVDDNETYRQHLQQQLRTWSLSSETASQGEVALALLDREAKAGRPFHFILTGMNLTDMDGVALARAVRSNTALSAAKILVMTHSDAPMDSETCQSLGFSGWVPKPAKAEELYDRFASLIEPNSPHIHAA